MSGYGFTMYCENIRNPNSLHASGLATGQSRYRMTCRTCGRQRELPLPGEVVPQVRYCLVEWPETKCMFCCSCCKCRIRAIIYGQLLALEVLE